MTAWEAERGPVAIEVTVTRADVPEALGGSASVLSGVTVRGQRVTFAVDPRAALRIMAAAQRDGQCVALVEGWQLLPTRPEEAWQ